MFIHRNMAGRLLAMMMMSLIAIWAVITPAIVEACEGGGEEKEESKVTCPSPVNFGKITPPATLEKAVDCKASGSLFFEGEKSSITPVKGNAFTIAKDECNKDIFSSPFGCEVFVLFTPTGSKETFSSTLTVHYHPTSEPSNTKITTATLKGED
jgi:hypothetical protein